MTQRRLWLVPALLAGHAALLLVALPVAPMAQARPTAALELTEIAAPLLARVELPPLDTAIPVEASAPQLDIAPDPATTATACALADDVRRALQDSPAAAAALLDVPVANRSVAAAMMLWDGSWTRAAPEPVREIVAATLDRSAAQCREVRLSGPRLVIVATADGPVILAFGSGEWAWSEL